MIRSEESIEAAFREDQWKLMQVPRGQDRDKGESGVDRPWGLIGREG